MGENFRDLQVFAGLFFMRLQKFLSKIACGSKAFLEQGCGIALSAFSEESRKGHIVRLQAIEPDGLRLDDPYGDVSKKLAEREAGKSGYYKKEQYDNLNKKTIESGAGEDNLWTWENIQKTTLKYAIIIKNN